MRDIPIKVSLTAIIGLVVLVGASLLLWPRAETDPRLEDDWPIVGMISNNPNGIRNILGFRSGLSNHGYKDGESVMLLFSGKPTASDQLEATVKEMVDEGADLIFTAGTPTGIAAYNVTRDAGVPVVFGVIADPVSAGVLTDLSRPGGNMTGVMLSENQARRLQLLHNLLPDVKRVLFPYNPEDAAPVSAVAQLEQPAREMGLTLVHALARNDQDVTEFFDEFPDDIDAVFMLPDSTFNRRQDELIALAVERGLPVSGPSTAQVEAGAVMSYGIVHHEVGIQAARIAAQILRGAEPGTIPVEIADYYLTFNVAAADRIGLSLSQSVLQQADVILREDDFEE